MLYAIIFSHQICFPSSRPPCILSGKGESPTQHLSEASRAHFFYPEKILSGSLPSSGSAINSLCVFYPILFSKSNGQLNSPGGLDYIQLRSRSGLESNSLPPTIPHRLSFFFSIPPPFLPFPLSSPFPSIALCCKGPGHTQRILQE